MSLKYIHFIGCGGAGTQPLALIFHELGYHCFGSDLIENNRTKALKEAGVSVSENLSENNFTDNNCTCHSIKQS